MSKAIKPSDLGEALSRELKVYSEEVTERVNAAGAEAIKKLVKLARASAPASTGAFKKSLASKAVTEGQGLKKYVLYARAPEHRIFHLLVHGHAKKNGGRVPGDPFLQNALNKVLPEYEKEIEEAIQ